MRLDLYSEEGKNAQRDWRISKEKNISGCGRAQVIVKLYPAPQEVTEDTAVQTHNSTDRNKNTRMALTSHFQTQSNRRR